MKKLLDGYMKENSYVFEEPGDLSVAYNVTDFEQSVSLKRIITVKYRGFKRVIKKCL